METKWLKDFLMLAETGNFTRAAENLNSSQTALSRRIQSLEAWLGVKLVDRTLFPTRLTPEGEVFRRSAEDILKQINEARAEVSGVPRVDQLRIALPYAVATASFPEWWKRQSHALTLSCKIELGNVHDMMMALATETVDLLICFQHPEQMVHLDTKAFEMKELWRESIAPYASSASGLPDDVFRISRSDRRVPLLMYSRGVYIGALVDRMIENAGFDVHARTLAECDMSDVLREMAAQGLGIAWLPEGSACKAGDALVRLDEPALTSTLTIAAWRKRANTRPVLETIWSRLCAL